LPNPSRFTDTLMSVSLVFLVISAVRMAAVPVGAAAVADSARGVKMR
jgi:hypothetical protein